MSLFFITQIVSVTQNVIRCTQQVCQRNWSNSYIG